MVFADGVPFNASDVVETYRMCMTPGFGGVDSYNGPELYDDLGSVFESNSSIVALDNHTVQFTLKQYEPRFFDYLSLGIVPTHTHGTNVNPAIAPGVYRYETQIALDLWINGTSPYGLGTGPFVYSGVSNNSDWSVESNTKDGNISLSKNPNYWNEKVGLDKIYFNKYGDTETSINDVIAGNVQLVWGY